MNEDECFLLAVEVLDKVRALPRQADRLAFVSLLFVHAYKDEGMNLGDAFRDLTYLFPITGEK